MKRFETLSTLTLTLTLALAARLSAQVTSAPASAAPAGRPAGGPAPKLETIRPDEWVFWDQPRYAEEMFVFLRTNYYLSEAQMAAMQADIVRLNTARNKAMPDYIKQMLVLQNELEDWRANLAKEGVQNADPDQALLDKEKRIKRAEAFQTIWDNKWKLRNESPASPSAIIDRVEAQLTPDELRAVYEKRREKAGVKITEINKAANVPASQPSDEDRRREEDRQKTEKLRQELEELRKKNADILNKRATLTPPASMPSTFPTTRPANNPFLKEPPLHD